MTDRETWNLAVAAVTAEFAALPPARQAIVAELAGVVKREKEALHAAVDKVSAGEICTSCGGECCLTGKFHFTVVDLLVYLAEGRELFIPGFHQGRCPYLGAQGCLMAPPYRPFNCVTFNCEQVESLLEPAEKERCVLRERELRTLYGKFEELFANRFMGGLLMNCERDVIQRRGTILKKR
ncbi:MAG TPA: hypothetical protein VEM32_00870 [Geobacteraceae bacterium]|nr:hypothetical protein [Geobacteraceae bacterium]